MHRNQAAPSVVYENGRFEGAVDCPNDVQGKKKKKEERKKTFNNRENGKKKRKKKKAVYSHAHSGCLAPSDNGVPLGFLNNNNNNNKQKQLVSPPPSYMSTLHLAWLIAAIGARILGLR
jgi:hypothetical protein